MVQGIFALYLEMSVVKQLLGSAMSLPMDHDVYTSSFRKPIKDPSINAQKTRSRVKNHGPRNICALFGDEHGEATCGKCYEPGTPFRY